MLGLEAERTLRDLGERGDIIKTMHHAFAERGAGPRLHKTSLSTAAGLGTRSSGGWSQPDCMMSRPAQPMP